MAGNTEVFLKNVTIRYTDHVSADVQLICGRRLMLAQIRSRNLFKEFSDPVIESAYGGRGRL